MKDMAGGCGLLLEWCLQSMGGRACAGGLCLAPASSGSLPSVPSPVQLSALVGLPLGFPPLSTFLAGVVRPAAAGPRSGQRARAHPASGVHAQGAG